MPVQEAVEIDATRKPGATVYDTEVFDLDCSTEIMDIPEVSVTGRHGIEGQD